MTEREKKRELEKRAREQKLEQERSQREFKRKVAEGKKQWRLAEEKTKKWQEEWEAEVQEAGGFMYEKYALAGLGVTQEQWKLVKPKLEKVAKLQDLCNVERSTSGLSLGGSNTGGTGSKTSAKQSEPRLQWKRPWKDKDPADLSEAQRLAEQLIKLLDKKNATPEEFKEKMAALRKARIAEAPAGQERQEKLAEAKQELRQGMTARQEAALVLLGRL
jgi:hypothetical protein